ncbi:hypothetical protein SH661x_001386 [Planctomicrobium sp. SH661]|uniref:hypothetical protein n=1 Tax=Planctomicrobium sp. SH661 TaxID=3448124 RepID=UPI003F5C00EB
MESRFRAGSLLGLCGLLVLSVNSAVCGQEPPVPAIPEVVAPKDDPENQSSPKFIYLPYSDLNGTFEKPEASAVVPSGEYRRLLKALQESQASLTLPDALISQADYEITVERDFARIKAQLKVHVMRQGWSELPVNFAGATIGSLSSDDQVLMRGRGDGRNTLLFPKEGEYDVELQLAAPVHQSPEAKEIAFECPPVALTSVRFTAPGAGQQVTLTPAGRPLRIEEKTPETTQVNAQVGVTGKLSIKWRAADSQKPTMDLLTSVNNRTLLTIADGLIHTETWLTYDILRGELDQARILLPKSTRLLDVLANQGVANWSTAEEGENQILTVKLTQPARQQLQITLRSESPLTESEFPVAGVSPDKVTGGIHAMDAVRESGQIAIRHSADLSVNVVQQQGLVRIESAEADPKLAGPNAMLFKFYSPQISLVLNSKPVEPRISVDQQIAIVLQEEELQFTNQLAYQIELAGLFEVVLQLPEGAIIDQVTCPQLKEFSVDPATRKLTVSLRERTLGTLGLLVQGHVSLKGQDSPEFKLPLLEPLSVERETGKVQLSAKESLEVQVLPEGLEAAQPLPIGGNTRRGDLVTFAAWTFNRRPVVIPVRVVHKPTRLRASVGTLISVDPEVTHVTSKVSFQVQYSPLGEFRIEVPEAISGRLQIEVEPGNTACAPIKQKTAGTAENGKVVWTIQTQRDVMGDQTFLLSYDLPSPAAQNATEKTLALQFVRPLGLVDDAGEVTTPLVEMRGEISLKKEKTLAISAVSSGEGIEQVDVRELTLLPRDGTLAFRYFRNDQDQPVGLNVQAGRFDIQDVVDTVVTRGLIEIVTSEDQAITYRCRFRVKSSERQRLLVALPPGLEVLGAFLNDREVKLEKADVPVPPSINQSLTPYWINVARPESSETPFLLTFQFLWNLKSGKHAHLLEESLLHLPIPAVAGGNQGVVQELKVIVWMPEQFTLLGDPDPFLLQKNRRPLSFILGTPADHRTSHLGDWVTDGGRGAGGFAELPTEGREAFVYTTLGNAGEITLRVWNKLWMTLLVSVTIVLIAWILLGTSWENKLGVLLLMAFAATLYGMFDSFGLWQLLHAARYGLLVMLAMWFLRGFFNLLRPQRGPDRRDYHPTNVPYAVIPPPGVFDHLQPDSGNAS